MRNGRESRGTPWYRTRRRSRLLCSPSAEAVRGATIAILPLNMRSRQGPPTGMGLHPGRNPLIKDRDALLRAAVPLGSRPLKTPTERAHIAVGLPRDLPSYDQAVLSRQLVVASAVAGLDHGRTDRPAFVHYVGSHGRIPPRPLRPDAACPHRHLHQSADSPIWCLHLSGWRGDRVAPTGSASQPCVVVGQRSDLGIGLRAGARLLLPGATMGRSRRRSPW